MRLLIKNADIIIIGVVFALLVLTACSGCALIRSSGPKHSFPSEYRSQLHGWLNNAEQELDLKYRGKGITVRIVDGDRVTRGRARAPIEGTIRPSHARLGRDLVYLVRYPNGSIKPEEAIHEMQHMIGDSHGWPRDNDWHHAEFERRGSRY